MNYRQRNALIGGGIVLLLIILTIVYFVLRKPTTQSDTPPTPTSPTQPPSAPGYVEYPPLGEATPDIPPPSDTPPVPVRKSRGEECEAHEECANGLTCFNGVCQSLKKEGEDCVVDENCADGECYFERTTSKLGKCTNKKKAGETCDNKNKCIPYVDCKSGGGCTVLVCDNGKCTPVKIALLYGACTRSEQCYPNGKCLNGKCYPNYALGEACTYDQDCGAYPNTYCHSTLKKCYARPLAL